MAGQQAATRATKRVAPPQARAAPSPTWSESSRQLAALVLTVGLEIAELQSPVLMLAIRLRRLVY